MKPYSLESLLSLFSIKSIGPTRMRKLISVLGSPENVLQASQRQLAEVEGIDQITAQKIKNGPDDAFVREQLELVEQEQVGILTYWDDHFPTRLKKIYDPPAFLFYKGNLECLDEKAFAIVGTRMPTSYGRMITERFTRELVFNDFLIVSGFARGVDTHAHKTCLKYNGRTIAVLGNGIDHVYPAENRELREEITRNGLMLSEYPMGTKPDAVNFPKRNRIISGLSLGVLLTEAGEKSGALITAYYAVDQNREVFAVPGSITSGKSAGTNGMIKKGAKLVQTVKDILEELDGQVQLKLNLGESKKGTEGLNGPLKIIYDNLGEEAIHIDQLAFKTDLSPAETLSGLLTLELMGLIRQMAGKMFVRY